MAENMTALLNALLDFAEDKELIAAEDRAYTLNRLLEIVEMDAPEDAPLPPRTPSPDTATPILNAILDIAAARGLFADSAQRRDLFSAKLMGALTPAPALVRERFSQLCAAQGAKAFLPPFAMRRTGNHHQPFQA